tara:strand:+ start:13111 stop:15003 length:1893 start_codon:yes stop_codon:yes gene_type:complete
VSFNLREDIKILILIPALFLSYDYLQPWMVSYFSALLLLTALFKPWTIVAYANFAASYFIFKTVGFYIIPETTVPNLAVYLISQLILNKRSRRNEFYLVFLWLGAFALFSSSLYYIIYAFVSLLIVFIIDETQSSLSLVNIIKSLWKYKGQFFFITLITVILFIFFPRFYQFLPTANLVPQGKIGYSKEINNSETTNLQLSSQVAFYAELQSNLPSEYLYWRGRVLNYTDGYNWKKSGQIVQKIDYDTPEKMMKHTVKYEQDFEGDLVLLNTPVEVVDSNLGLYSNKLNSTFKGYTKKKKAVITAYSHIKGLKGIKLTSKVKDYYLQLPNFSPKAVQDFFQQINHPDLNTFLKNFKQKIINDKYTYTLSPGQLTTISDFLRTKKGYCTHFASLMGITLRMKGIPTRLVSGFQGGQYNNVGNFYLIKSNDAHVWVEYFHEGRWVSIDPTGFIAPDRINLGGSQFLTTGISIEQEKKNNWIRSNYYEIKNIFETLNYRVSLFLDNYDRNKQKDLSNSLKLSRKAFYILGFIILVLVSLGIYFFNRNKVSKNLHPLDRLLYKWGKKFKLDFSQTKTLSELRKFSNCFDSPKDFETFVQKFQECRYAQRGNPKELNLILKRLRRVDRQVEQELK